MHWHAPTDIIFYIPILDGINPTLMVKNSCKSAIYVMYNIKIQKQKSRDRHCGEKDEKQIFTKSTKHA